MRIRIIITFVVFVSSLLCFSQGRNKINYIILSGEIENVKTQFNGERTIQLSLSIYPKEVTKKIKLNADGRFTDTITSQDGLYYIWDENNVVPIYLRKSEKYELAYDAENFMGNGKVVIRGADTSINRYFIEKIQKRIFIDRNNIDRSEEEFRTLIGDIRKQQLLRLESANLPTHLNLNEQKLIQYEYLSELLFFLEIKEKYQPSFERSQISKTELNIDYNNERDYKENGYYRKLLDLYYSGKLNFLKEKFIKTDTSYSLNQNVIKLFDSIISNKYIKNEMIARDARYYLKEAKDKRSFYNDFLKYYTGKDENLKADMQEDYMRFSKLKKGTTSPEFTGYLNFKGGTSSLKDFKGKYVYIDIWATWCGNCWNELPHMKNIEKDYSGKNITFISISWDKFESEWRKVIKEKKMEGVQLLAKNREDDFFRKYAVYGIPRYIFIDPQGRIIDYNAPRPSKKEKLLELFKNNGL